MNLMRKWKGVIVLLIMVALVIWGLLNLPQIMNAVQGKYTAWKTQRQIAALGRPYKTDKIGGQTPEETFDMFIDALKKEDIELASKYFVIKKQDDWEKTLEEYKKNDLLANFVVELQKNKSTWQLLEKDEYGASFKYSFIIEKAFTESLPIANGKTQEVTYPAGKYDNEVKFEKYPMGVWKISVL